ncbi:MAG: antitoxin [Geodermatophilaceae bacterium]
MRTTVDLPDDVHRLAISVARDRGTTLSEAIAELILRGLGVDQQPGVGVDSSTGLPVYD